MPAVDGAVRDELALKYLQNTMTIEGQPGAPSTAMSDRERDVYLGGQTIQKYGCYGCHGIAGFEDAKPIGVELTEEGSKPLHQFDFGHVHDVPHTRQDWIKTKLLRPRIWDHGKELVKNYDELYRIAGLRYVRARGPRRHDQRPSASSRMCVRPESKVPDNATIAEGRKLITWYNCQGLSPSGG